MQQPFSLCLDVYIFRLGGKKCWSGGRVYLTTVTSPRFDSRGLPPFSFLCLRNTEGVVDNLELSLRSWCGVSYSTVLPPARLSRLRTETLQGARWHLRKQQRPHL